MSEVVLNEEIIEKFNVLEAENHNLKEKNDELMKKLLTWNKS